jgi:phenylalanine-4-hydroxylase
MNARSEDEASTRSLVELDRDHPGFRDPTYRRRRDQIAGIALQYRRPDPLPRVEYTDEEHGTWKIALDHLRPMHQRLACRAYLDNWPVLGFETGRIMQFAEASAILARETGFRLEPVAGLVTPRDFLINLADRVFLATQYVRHASTPLYTPEPDVLHELIGHAALLCDPEFARMNHRFGQAACAATDAEVEQLIRAYWYALEFGIVRENGDLKAVGAGLLSSYGELGRFADSAELRPFSVAAVASTPFDPTNYQAALFVAESADAMFAELDNWLASIADR